MTRDAPRRTRITDYLIVIREECQVKRHATTGAVARCIGVSNGTASSKLKQLAELGMIEWEPYTGARLSTAGILLCRTAYRRQQLLELFLQRLLPLSREDIEQQAWAMEITLTDGCVAAIDEYLGRPTRDIRSEPIVA